MQHRHSFLNALRHFRPAALVLLAAAFAFSAQSFSKEPATTPAAPNWMVKTSEGKNISLQEELQKGNKIVAVFWATWCGYCRALLPEINGLYEAQKKDASSKTTFIAFNIWEDADPTSYATKKNISLPIVLKAESIAKKYGVKGTPGVFVIGDNNSILYQRTTGESPSLVIKKITKALTSSSE